MYIIFLYVLYIYIYMVSRGNHPSLKFRLVDHGNSSRDMIDVQHSGAQMGTHKP